MILKKMFLLTALVVLLFTGCSDEKEELQSQQQVEQPIVKKELQIPLDSPRIITLKDFDPNDSILVGVRAFRAARKEFVKRWNYTKNTELFMRVVDDICMKKRRCAAMLDSIAYKNDVSYILDSLMRNDILDSVIEAKKEEMIEREKGCFGRNKFTTSCQKKINEELKKRIREEREKASR